MFLFQNNFSRNGRVWSEGGGAGGGHKREWEGKIQGQVMGEGKVSAENWRVKEFKRREQKKKTKKKRLSYKTNSRSPASGGCYVIYDINYICYVYYI